MANYKDIRYNFALPSNAAVGSMTLIKTVTASSDGTIDFLNGSSDVVLEFSFQADTGTNTSYNQTVTSTFFKAQHRQDDAVTGLSYDTGADLAQSTNFQRLGFNLDNSNEDSFSGTLTIFEPYSSTFVKHFISTNNYTYDGDANEQYTFNTFVAGYFNTTTALTRFRFKMESGNIDAGTFKLYGIKN